MTGLSLRHERHPFSLVLFSHGHLSGVHICDTLPHNSPSTHGIPQETGASRGNWGLQIERSQYLLSLTSHPVVTAADIGTQALKVLT